ncbi:MAG: LssY C-terminal domain-containing protein [Deltaproteobacteria bacterium]|nr:LssY C-terminal domain-containing protein [Deltaproteobacteria bacterium]
MGDLIWFSAIGAIMGDNINYYLGKRYGAKWVREGFWFLKAQHIEKARHFMDAHGVKSIFLGRFIPSVKWLITSKGRIFFSVVNSLWKSVKQAVQNNEHVVRWLKKHSVVVSFFQKRLQTSTFSGLPLSMLMLAFIYILALLAGVIEDLITSDPIVAVDIRIANLLAAFRTDDLTDIFSWITLLGKSQVILAFIAISVALLLLWRKNYFILPLFIAVTGSEAFTYFGKLAFHRPRPELAVYVEHSFSFPSGHAAIGFAFYGFVGYLLIRFAKTWKRKVNIFFITITIILAIGLSRIYLGVHYISDIWGGYLVGAMWLVIAGSLCEWIAQKNKEDKSISPVGAARSISVGLLLIAMLFYVGFASKYHYLPASAPSNQNVIVYSATDIFSNGQLKYTETVTGERHEPVNIIFIAKDNPHLINIIQQGGWVITEKASIRSFINALRAVLLKNQYLSAPISPSFWNARVQDMSFIKSTTAISYGNAHHLRIWRTNSRLRNGGYIYVGMVNAINAIKWGVIPKISPYTDVARELLYQDLNLTGNMRSSQKVQLVKPQIGRNFMGDRFFSDGKAYIISMQ